MASTNEIEGFRLPEGLSKQGDLLPWLKQKSLPALRKMDRGDSLHPASKDARPRDGKLARIEIFNAVIDDYKLATQKAVRAGLKENWGRWEHYQKERDRLAQVVQELGWKPAFHISDRDYQRRIVELIRREPPKDMASLQRLFRLSEPNWEQGGLCFGYPRDFQETRHEFTAEETVKACKSHDVARWGECNGSARKVIALMTSVLAVYPGVPPAMDWWLIQDLPNSSRGHSFIALRENDYDLPMDAAFYGFSLKSSVYQKQDPYRISIATYYSNLAVGPGMERKYAEKEVLYRKAVEINPNYDLGWNNLGAVSVKLGRPGEARGYFLKALSINPKNDLAQFNLNNLEEGKK